MEKTYQISKYRSMEIANLQELAAMSREKVLRFLFHLEVDREQAESLTPAQSTNGGGNGNLVYEHEQLAGSDAIMAAGGAAMAAGGAAAVGAGESAPPVQVQAQAQRVASEFEGVGRNDLCPCGSGKKFKKCHGA